MRRIYIDEAGTSSKEPVAVVVALIIDPDRQWKEIESRLQDIRDRHIPKQFHRGFCFHAKDIYSNGKQYKSMNLPMSTRLRIIYELLDIVREMNTPTAVGYAAKDGSELGPKGRRFSHFLAFAQACGLADRYIREFHSEEVGSIVAEDCPDMRNILRRVPDLMSVISISEHFSTLTHIVDGIQFAEKSESPILQLADVCAYAIRRYIADLRFSVDMIYHLTGSHATREELLAPTAGQALLIYR